MTFDPTAPTPGRFKLEVQGLDAGRFNEASGLDMEAGDDYRHGPQMPSVRRPAPERGVTLTLRRGTAVDAVIREWQQNSATGQQDRRTIVLILLDDAGHEITRWSIFGCWPARYIALGDGVKPGESVVEELELKGDRVEQQGENQRISPAG